jgi:glycosyltransferase involved in cell wall biosynthesis
MAPESIRLLFMCPTLVEGGAERQWSILIPRLAERGFDVSVLTLADEGRFFHELRAGGIPTECAWMRRRTDWRRLRSALARGPRPVDAIVTRSVSAQVVGELVATRYRVPHVTTEHTGSDGQGRLRPLRRHQWALLRAAAPSIDRLIAVAETQVPGLVRLGFKPSRIRVIPNAISPDDLRVTTPSRQVRAALNLGDDDFVALFLGTLRPEKRAPLFVEAVLHAHRRNRRIRGLVAGDGPDRDAVRSAAKQEPDAVRLVGSRSDVGDLIHASDVVCSSSAYEALPMIALEAMAVGRPVIAPDIGGVRDAVVSGKTGILLPEFDAERLAEALVSLADDPLQAREMGRAGHARQRQQFTIERMVDDYAATFEDVCRDHRARIAAAPSEARAS